jgi:hypothetical protein
MNEGTTSDSLDQLLAKNFTELGASEASPTQTILIKDRYFVGHRYRCGELQAVVLAGATVIEFYDKTGRLLKSVGLEETEKKIAA